MWAHLRFSRCSANTRDRADLRSTRPRVGRVDRHSNKYDKGEPSLSHLQKLVVLAKSAPVEVKDDDPIEPWSLDRRLNEATITEMIRRYESGVGTPQLCRDFKLSKYSVLKVLHSQGVAMRRQPLAPSDRANVVRLYRDGSTMSEIAELLGTGLGQVRQSLIDAGVQIHRSGRRRPA